MAEAPVTITIDDEGAAHHYRTELPNIVDEMGLTPYAFRLYAHLKRTAGDGGVCTRGYRNMAAKCSMSVGMVGKARKELVEHGLIRCTTKPKGPHGREGYHITICDLWAANMIHFAPGGPGRRTVAPITQAGLEMFGKVLARREKHWAERMKGTEEVRAACVAVSAALNIQPTKSQLSFWAKGAAELLEVCGGQSAALIPAAIADMRARGLVMSSPKSLITTVQRLKAAMPTEGASTVVYKAEVYDAE